MKKEFSVIIVLINSNIERERTVNACTYVHVNRVNRVMNPLGSLDRAKSLRFSEEVMGPNMHLHSLDNRCQLLDIHRHDRLIDHCQVHHMNCWVHHMNCLVANTSLEALPTSNWRKQVTKSANEWKKDKKCLNFTNFQNEKKKLRIL